MAKSIRSKRRQRVRSVRRAKYAEVEKKKCWDKYLATKAEKTEEIEDVEECSTEAVPACPSDVLPSEGINEVCMDTTNPSTKKLSNNQLRKVQQKRKAKREKRKTKRLGGKKSHSRW